MDVSLNALSRMRPLLNLAALAREAGIPEQTLYSRVRRGSPELDEDEQKAVKAAFRKHSICPA